VCLCRVEQNDLPETSFYRMTQRRIRFSLNAFDEASNEKSRQQAAFRSEASQTLTER